MRLLGILMLAAACGPGDRHDGMTQLDAPVQPMPDGSDIQPDTSRVYAHSGSKLFRVDADSFAPIEVGTMAGLGMMSLTDLAIDKSDQMIGITLDKLYSIEPTTGAVTLI